jgi:hypothetical protein
MKSRRSRPSLSGFSLRLSDTSAVLCWGGEAMSDCGVALCVSLTWRKANGPEDR